jgi:ribonuclease P protein component
LHRFHFPKTHRLVAGGDFQRVYRAGRRLHGNGFTLIILPNTLPWNRLGISVQRKTGSAVRRNRIKRLIRETFRLNRELFPAASDIVVTVRPGFALDSLAEVRTAMARLLEPMRTDGRRDAG